MGGLEGADPGGLAAEPAPLGPLLDQEGKTTSILLGSVTGDLENKLIEDRLTRKEVHNFTTIDVYRSSQKGSEIQRHG